MIATIVVAAGQGRRFGGKVPKQFLPLEDRPLLAHSLVSFDRQSQVDEIVLVTNLEWLPRIQQEIISRFQIRKVSAIVAGGKERQDSVAAGLQAITGASPLVAVHDAVRPLFSNQLFERTVAGCQDADGCIPACAPRDTVKQVERGSVIRTLPRESLRLAQTPQVFRRDVLQHAFAYAHEHSLIATDEAALVEAAGGTLVWVEGEERNLKITSPLDLRVAELFCQESC